MSWTILQLTEFKYQDYNTLVRLSTNVNCEPLPISQQRFPHAFDKWASAMVNDLDHNKTDTAELGLGLTPSQERALSTAILRHSNRADVLRQSFESDTAKRKLKEFLWTLALQFSATMYLGPVHGDDDVVRILSAFARIFNYHQRETARFVAEGASRPSPSPRPSPTTNLLRSFGPEEPKSRISVQIPQKRKEIDSSGPDQSNQADGRPLVRRGEARQSRPAMSSEDEIIMKSPSIQKKKVRRMKPAVLITEESTLARASARRSSIEVNNEFESTEKKSTPARASTRGKKVNYQVDSDEEEPIPARVSNSSKKVRKRTGGTSAEASGDRRSTIVVDFLSSPGVIKDDDYDPESDDIYNTTPPPRDNGRGRHLRKST
jgi:hypothetical protein